MSDAFFPVSFGSFSAARSGSFFFCHSSFSGSVSERLFACACACYLHQVESIFIFTFLLEACSEYKSTVPSYCCRFHIIIMKRRNEQKRKTINYYIRIDGEQTVATKKLRTNMSAMEKFYYTLVNCWAVGLSGAQGVCVASTRRTRRMEKWEARVNTEQLSISMR